MDAQIRQLIRRLKAENSTWGAPRIHGELLQLGFEISEPTVSRYLHNLDGCLDEGRAKRGLAFLNNHREVIGAFDFFTVASPTFRTLYRFFVIENGRRPILHFNVTEHPTSDWIVQQLREALPLPCPYRYILFDHDQVRQRCGRVSPGQFHETHAHQRSAPVAERSGGTLGRQCSPPNA